MFRLGLILICGLLYSVAVHAQRDVKDSLLQVLDSGAKGEVRVNALNELAYQYYDYNDSLAFEYANQALSEAIKIKYSKGIKYAYTLVGLGYASKSMHSWAILNYRKSHAVKSPDTDGISVYNLMLWGNTYRDQSMYDSAEYLYNVAIKNFGTSDKSHLATLYKDFALIKLRLWENRAALKYLDSASVILKDYPDPYGELDVWSTYGEVYQNVMEFDKSEDYFSRMCLRAKELEDNYHQIKCFLNTAQLYNRKGSFPVALKNALKALELSELYNYPPQRVMVLIEVGSIYNKLSEYDLASKFLFQALRISEEYGLSYETGKTYVQLAWVYKDQRNYPVALSYSNQAQAIFERINDQYGIASCHGVRGLIFYLQKKYAQSLAEHQSAKQIREKIDHQEGIAAAIFNMSLVYIELNNREKALSLQKEAIAIEEGFPGSNNYSLSISYNQMASMLISSGNFSEAERYLEKSRSLAKKSQSKLLLRNTAGFYADLYEAKKDYKKALEFKKLYQSLNDSIYSEASVGKFAEMQALYQLEKKDQEIKLLSTEKDLQNSKLEVQESRLQFQLLIIVSAIIGLILSSVVAFSFYRNSQRIRKLNREISERNEEIQAQSEELSESNQLLLNLNAEIVEKNEEIQAQSEELTEANQTISLINRNLETKVDERTIELKQAYKELDTFFYRSSHDFRRPLTTFMGLAEVAKITIKDLNALELFSKVNDTAHYLDKMLVKLQSISDVGGQELVFKEIFLKEIFDTVCDTFREDLKSKNIKTFCEIELKETFISYPALLRIAVENLIENSIFFSRKNDPVIHFNAYAEDGEVVLQVIDNGEGIPQEYQDRIFEMYFRANERSKGNGLGLYIVKKAVEKLGGRISVRSELNGGSQFTMRFSGKQI